MPCCYTILCYNIMTIHHITLCYVMLCCYIMLCYVMLHYVVMLYCYVMSSEMVKPKTSTIGTSISSRQYNKTGHINLKNTAFFMILASILMNTVSCISITSLSSLPYIRWSLTSTKNCWDHLQGLQTLTSTDPRWPLTCTKNNRAHVFFMGNLYNKYELDALNMI